MFEGGSHLVPGSVSNSCKQVSNWLFSNFMLNKRPLEIETEENEPPRKACKHSNSAQTAIDSQDHSNDDDSQDHPNDDDSQDHSSDDDSSDDLIPGIGWDNSISCLIHCSRSDYGSIALLNKSFHSLVRNGELYKLRKQNGVIEHWIYFSCHLLEWEAFDPVSERWMRLPRMISDQFAIFPDRESLAVGTELLVFTRDIVTSTNVIYKYSILTHSWSSGTQMNFPRCLFGSASLGEIAILAGGCDSRGNIVSSAEMYNSETQQWETLPNMNKPRNMCSGVFMDGKFYVIGGIGVADSKQSRVLTSGEEFDLKTRTWTEIPNMSPARVITENETVAAASEAPPLLAVVNNELFAADHASMEVRKYDKKKRVWFTIGRLPERAGSMNGWGLAFKACGDKLIVVGGPRASGQGFIELNSWDPSEGPEPRWNLLGRKRSSNFVYNCAVMGC